MSDKVAPKVNTIKPAVYSSLAMAFAGIGDAFLYPFLPLYASTLKIPLAWVGILLAVNRFARILLSPFIVKSISRFGIREITIFASLLAVGSTLAYGLNLGLTAWLFFRIIWGACFSALRISTTSYALNNANKGFALGLGNGLYEIGPVLALWLGPLMLSYCKAEHVFHLLALLSAFGFYFAYQLPPLTYIHSNQGLSKIKVPPIVNILTFSTAFTAEGLIITTISLFIQQHYKASAPAATSIAATFLLLRRISSIVVSPAGGILAEHFGSKRIITVSLISISIGILLLVNGIFVPAVIAVFCFNVILNVIFPIEASAGSNDKIQAIAQNSLWKDSGVACGTLVGGLLLSDAYLKDFLLVFSLLQLLLVIYQNKDH